MPTLGTRIGKEHLSLKPHPKEIDKHYWINTERLGKSLPMNSTKMLKKPDVITFTCDPSTGEVAMGGSKVQGQNRIHVIKKEKEKKKYKLGREFLVFLKQNKNR